MRSASNIGAAEVEAMSLEEIFIAIAGASRGDAETRRKS
jgi:hypothetical protein